MPHNPQKLIEDMQRAVDEISEFCAGVEFDDFQRDRKLQLIVERELEIVGEALSRLRRDHPEVAEKIEDAGKIIGLRNILAHGYDMLEYEILWDVVVSKLPALKRDLCNVQSFSP